MILPISYAGNPVLYKKAKEIPIKEIPSAKIQSVLRDLGETVSHYSYAAGLAAPQVGKSLQIFCLELEKASITFDSIRPQNFSIPPNKPFFFINPTLKFPEPATDIMGEGCLSIPFYHVFIERYKNVHVSAYTQAGEYFEILAKGLFARYIQHEVDHLQGILTFHRAKSVDDIVFDQPE